jgi:hypothetical protein
MCDEQLYIAIYRSRKGYGGNCADCILCMHFSYMGQDTSFCVVSHYVVITPPPKKRFMSRVPNKLDLSIYNSGTNKCT